MSDCTTMRELMLEAEITELRGEGSSALARHVRACAACRLTGRALIADTEALAVLVATSPRPVAGAPARIVGGIRRLHRGRVVSGRAILAALPLAAAIVLAILWRGPTELHPGPELVPMVAGPARSASPESKVSVAMAAAPMPETPTLRPEPPTRQALAVPVTRAAAPAELPRYVESSAKPSFDLPPIPRIVDAVSVTPAAGSRALVVQTRDPAVTVVWLTDERSPER
jgi:hypothetical protein